MTNSASASQHSNNFPFDFAPQPTQDADLLQQLDFVPGLKEVLTLRQVHALEHATVWVLSQSGGTMGGDNELLGGMSTDRGFYLYGRVSIVQLVARCRTVCFVADLERRVGFGSPSALRHEFVGGDVTGGGIGCGYQFSSASGTNFTVFGPGGGGGGGGSVGSGFGCFGSALRDDGDSV